MSDKATPVRPRIVIHKTEPPDSIHGKALHECFFLRAADDLEGIFNLYRPNGKILAANVVSGQDFNFTIEQIHFNVGEFFIDESKAHGTWSGGPEADDGSFQATAGVGGDEDAEESASAASGY